MLWYCHKVPETWRFIKHRFWSPRGYQRRGVNCISASKKMLVARLSEDEDHYSDGPERAWCCKPSSGRGLGLKDIGLSTGSVLWLNPLLQSPLLRFHRLGDWVCTCRHEKKHPFLTKGTSFSVHKPFEGLENSVQQWSCLQYEKLTSYIKDSEFIIPY